VKVILTPAYSGVIFCPFWHLLANTPRRYMAAGEEALSLY